MSRRAPEKNRGRHGQRQEQNRRKRQSQRRLGQGARQRRRRQQESSEIDSYIEGERTVSRRERRVERQRTWSRERRRRRAALDPEGSVRLEKDALRKFEVLVRHLEPDDLKALMRCGQEEPQLYMYSYEEKRAWRPSPGEVAWPLEFMIGMFNRKHVLPKEKLPSLSEIGRATTDWMNRVRWKYAFENGSDAALARGSRP